MLATARFYSQGNLHDVVVVVVVVVGVVVVDVVVVVVDVDDVVGIF